MRHLLSVLLLSALSFVAAYNPSSAQVPRTMSFQGVLADNSGNPLSGRHDFTLRLYDDIAASVPLFTEQHIQVQVNNGLFNITIGSVSAIPANVSFNKPYFLGIAVDGGTEMSPRTTLTASPYSMRASSADSAKVAERLSSNASGVVKSLNAREGDITIVGTGGTTVTSNGQILTIESASAIQTLTNSDGTLTITNPSGPTTSVSIAPGSITGVHIQDNSITLQKLAPNTLPTALPPTGAAGGDLSGTYPNPAIAAGAVTTAKILDGTIVNADISNTAAIAYGKLSLNNSIVTGDLTDNSVTLPKLNTAGAASNQAITYNGTSIGWGNPSPGGAASGDLTGVYPNPTIATGAVNSAKIADGSIVNADVSATAAIAYSKLNLANSIITGDLTDGAVTLPKMSTSGATSGQGITFNGTNIIWGSPSPGGGAGGDLTGTYPSPTIAPGVVTSAKIADGTIVTVDLADGSVTDAKVANGISYSKLSGAPTSLPPTGAAGGDLTGTYPGPQIAPNAVTSAKILDGTIVNADVSPTAAIAYSKLTLTGSIVNGDMTANSITSNNVVDGTLITADLADGSVTTPKIVDANVTLPKISATGAASGQSIMFNGTSIVWGGATPGGAAGGDLTGTYPNPTIATGAVTSAKILDGTIVNADVSPTAAIAYSKLTLTNSIVTADLTDGSVNSAKILDGSIVNADVSPTAAIAYSKLALTNSLVTADHIDGSITLPKLATTGASSGQSIMFNGTSIVWGGATPGGAAGGDLTGTYPNPTIATGAVTSAKIADGTIVDADVSPTAAIAYSKLNLVNSIQNADIVANAITTSKVANGTVTTSKLADSAVSGLKLLTNAVQTAHIADGNVTLPKISSTGAASGQGITFNGTNIVWGSPSPGGSAGGDLTGTYPNPTIAASAVTSAKIADGTIVDADVSPTAAIAYSKLNLVNSIQNADIVANAITTSKVANGTVTTSKLADSAVSGLKLLTFAVQTAHIADGAVSDAKVANGISYSKLSGAPTSLPPSGAAGGDLTGTYPNPVVAANAVTSAKIADGTITNADVSAAAAIAYSKLNLSGSLQGSDVAAGTFTTTNAHHAIGNNDNTAREVRFLEPSGSGVNYTAFKAQAQAADLTYTLPNTAPTSASQVLQVQAVAGNNATLSWASVGGGSILFARTGIIANAGNTSYNVVAADDIIGIDMSAGTNFTVNLTAATTAGEILIVKIEKYNNALLPVLTIQPSGTDKIDGANNLAFGNAGGNRRLYSDGAGNWYTW